MKLPDKNGKLVSHIRVARPITAHTLKAALELDTETGCLNWPYATNSDGYGRVWLDTRRVTPHRLAAFLGGLVDSPDAPKDPRASTYIRHRCDNPKCCNVEHFDIGTRGQNQSDAYTRGRRDHVDPTKRLTPEQKGEAHRLSNGGMPSGEIAKLFGVCRQTMYTIIRAEKRGRKTPPTGADRVDAKLTADQVRQVRAVYAAGGQSQKAIAASSGVSQAVVSLAIRRKTYKDIL